MNQRQARKFALRYVAENTRAIESAAIADQLWTGVDDPDVRRVMDEIDAIGDRLAERAGSQ